MYAAAHDLDLARDQTWKLFDRRAGWRDRQLFQLGVKLADDIVAQHEGQVGDCERWYGRSASLVPSCYALPQGHRADSNRRRAVGFDPSGLETARALSRAGEPAAACAVSHGRWCPAQRPAATRCLRDIREAAARLPNLEFVGFVPFGEIDAHFNAARVFVNTSDYEGFPNTFLQSWSRWIPTVSFFNTGSTLNGKPVVNVAANMDEMAGAVGRLMQDDILWYETGRRVRECYETFHTPDAALNAYERVFARVSRGLDGPRTLDVDVLEGRADTGWSA